MKDRYRSVNSRFIRERLAATPWQSHAYIDDLISLSQYIERGCNGFAASMHFRHLRESYPDEYFALIGELAPGRHEEEFGRRKSLEAGLWDRALPTQVPERVLYSDWLAAGGRA